MYLRTTTRKHRGQTCRYVHIVESVWQNGRSRQKTVLTLGRGKQIDPKRLRQIQALLGRLAGDDPAEGLEELDLGQVGYFGQVVVLQRIWEELGLDRLLKVRIKQRGISVPVELLVGVMVFNRLIAPRSKLALSGWIHRLYLAELFEKRILLHQFYRALDLLEEIKAVEIHLDGQCLDHITRISPQARPILKVLGTLPAQQTLARGVSICPRTCLARPPADEPPRASSRRKDLRRKVSNLG